MSESSESEGHRKLEGSSTWSALHHPAIRPMPADDDDDDDDDDQQEQQRTR